MTKKNPLSKRIIAVLFVLAVVCFGLIYFPLEGVAAFCYKASLEKLCAYYLVVVSVSLAMISAYSC